MPMQPWRLGDYPGSRSPTLQSRPRDPCRKIPDTPPDTIPAEVQEQLLAQEPQLRDQLSAFTRAPNTKPYLRALAPPLLAILDGSRDPALANDPALDYDDAAELTLLLEQL